MFTENKVQVLQILIVILLVVLAFFLGMLTEGVWCDNKIPLTPSIESELTSNETVPEDNEETLIENEETLTENEEEPIEDIFIGDINLDVIAGHLNLEGNESAPCEIVNAIDGRTYLDNTIEIYQFDVESIEYQNAVAFGTVLMYQTIEINVSACNNGYVLIIYDSYEGNREELIEKFTSIKM